MSISRVGILPGAYGMQAQIAMLWENALNVLIVGESTGWKTVEYVHDGIDAGIQKALIGMRHTDSEEAGMENYADLCDSR